VALYDGLDGLNVIMFLVGLAAITKSAQIPFSAWLPAAIAAPTPVSALVHSSTLVTAGVYLLIRFNEVISSSKTLFFIRLLTMLLSGLGACLEQDAKKIVALSTLSQLGVIIFSLSVGLWEIAFFHLLSHALFKSLLFICMGIYIHGRVNQQDLRGIGFQYTSIPVVSRYFLVSSLSLSGFPFLSGFYSKDSVVELFQASFIGVLSYSLLLLCILRTVIYRVRLLVSLYIVEMNSKVLILDLGERVLSLAPMLTLFGMSIMGGSILFRRSVPLFLVGFIPRLRISLLVMVIGVLLWVSFLSVTVKETRLVLKLRIYNFGLRLIWFLGDFFSSLRSVLLLRGGLLRRVDHGWVEVFGVQGIASKIKRYGGGFDLGVELGVGAYLYGGLMLILFIILIL